MSRSHVTLACRNQKRFEAHKTSSKMKTKLVGTNKLAMKRKIDLIESKSTSTKTVGDKRNPLKSELIEQMKILQTKYESIKRGPNLL